MDRHRLGENLLELIRRTSAFLPPDVEEVLQLRRKLEIKGDRADFALDLVAQNIDLAKRRSLPICQDTGTITFYVSCPVGFNQLEFQQAAKEAVVAATKIGYLRQNSVDSLTGKNTGNNLGPGSPNFYFSQQEAPDIDVRLMLKGGGCENMSAQYSLPTVFREKLYGRDLEGVRACILDTVFKAQGKGCAPGFLGVCIGGDHAAGYSFAKHQLLRRVDDINPLPELAQLEAKIMREANRLEIGPMGFGGKITIGSCKIGYLNRLPACFFVSVAYMCWAFRRRGVQMTADGDIKQWLYETPGEFDQVLASAETFTAPQKNVRVLNTPISEETVRSLHVGDVVLINGTIFTGRDAVHKYLYEGGELDIIKGGVIYHCGPVIVHNNGTYQVMAAGPTTSIREEPYQAEVIKKFNLRAVIGKGGMGAQTLQACEEYGAVYLHAIGGAAQIYALTVKSVDSVHLEQFGSPEAVWELRVEGFPAVVTMDSHGYSLHKEIECLSKMKLEKLYHPAFA